MPSLAEMRIALARQSNPIEMKNIGVNEAPGLNPKAYMSPGGINMPPPTGGAYTKSGMPIGGIDLDRQPGQQLQSQPLMQQQAQQPPQQPQMPPGGPQMPPGMPQGGPAMPQPSGNILQMTRPGQMLSAMGGNQITQPMAKGGLAKSVDQMKQEIKQKQGVTMQSPSSTRLIFQAEGPGGVKGINVPRHMWEGSKTMGGMKEVNDARAKVYGAENRDPLTLGQIGRIHKQTLQDHFAKPLDQQIKDEKDALGRLREARHIGKTANTLDESEKLDTVRHETDEQGRNYVGFASKGVAGHALYTSGTGKDQKHHVLNTCPGQTEGCGGGKDSSGVVDTTKGTCFAPVAEAQYPGAAIRRASHAQAKHDPAMTRDWILAHTGSMRDAANAADRKNLRLLFRPNVVDETDVSSRHVIKHLNDQRKAEDKPPIIANSYGKTNELHDPANGYYVTHSNVGPKTKKGQSIAENIARDKQRVNSTILAADSKGRDFVNEDGEKTPPKNSYMVTDVKRDSPFNKKMEEAIKYAKYWSAGRPESELSEQEKAEGPEGHFGPSGKPTTPANAHYGHTTLNGRRYDYQKQHILHPRLVQVGHNDDGSPHMIPTDSRFKDEEFLPKNRFMTKNGKKAGAILMTTPTTSTSNVGHQTSFTHHVNEGHIEHALKNKGEYEIDPPEQQEKSMGKEYAAPQPIKFLAGGGHVAFHHKAERDDHSAFPEQSFAGQLHNAHRDLHNDAEESHHLTLHRHMANMRKPVVLHKNMDTMRLELTRKGK